ncbi:EamA-like transporter family protein [Planktotalea frisia]|jgi:drug/metabolite transporter (DMT)-like permease|uniref:Riboflavin transporter n=2 Tax=Planktotalea frisia TaxID=696762 RepID=A0A1L9NXS9_9RHOB|nr:DMT family transporter [Planktotalea frisia]OJI93964.1 riboflavin transporter [Planktotalea frisia]PZX35287.1 EamA-like transporter family protein [Planktotalea frisia]
MSDLPNKHLPSHNPRLAIILMICATAFIAATTLLAKALGTDTLGAPLHPVQITHARFLFAALTLGSAALIMRPKLGPVDLKLHVMRTTCGAAGVTLMFAAAAFIPLADATAISFLNPVFAMVFAIFLLGEKVGPIRWSAAGIAMVGALVLLRPGSGAIAPGALLALGAALILGLEIVFIKRLSGREAPFQILLVNNGIGLVIATLAVLFVWEPPTGQQWLALAGVGVLMAAAQTCFLNSVARADASFVVPFSYGTLLFATLYDALIFGVIPTSVSLLGAGIIIAGAALLAWRQAITSKA